MTRRASSARILALLVVGGALLAPLFAARAQEPAAADSAARGDTLLPPGAPAGPEPHAAPPAPDTLRAPGVPGAPDSVDGAAADSTSPSDSAAVEPSATADSLAVPDTSGAAETLAADTSAPLADSAAADTLERVHADVEQARQRLEQVRETVETLPEEGRLRRSPRGAVLRAFALPGWGQFYTGHTVRGFLYAGAEVGFATLGFLKQREVLDLRDDIFAAKLDFVAAEQAAHPDSAFSREDSLELFERFEGTAEGATFLSSLEAKKKRREDYFTYAIFAVLFGAIDAFVSAHLEPFEDARLEVGPRPEDWRLGLTVPLGTDPDAGAAEDVRRR